MTTQQPKSWKVLSEGFDADPHQQQVIQYLQRLADRLSYQYSPWRQRWHNLKRIVFLRTTQPARGLYLWGSVGIGKTYLMDLFFSSLPMKHKLRLHFHRFMAVVHQQLTNLAGKKDPLQHVASHFAQRARIICFDEFYVDNIADAMLLGRLLQALFDRGVCMVMTSNQAPEALYPNGLQRQGFIPTIALLKRHMQVEHMLSSHDYRVASAGLPRNYAIELDRQSDDEMMRIFNQVAQGKGMAKATLIIAQRPIEAIYLAAQVVWFDFNQICHVPRSQNDYLAIAKRFNTVLISHVPQIGSNENNKISYLINLVDIFYDEGVELILSSKVELAKIYTTGSKLSEFQRTLSRLTEMQSLARICNMT